MEATSSTDQPVSIGGLIVPRPEGAVDDELDGRPVLTLPDFSMLIWNEITIDDAPSDVLAEGAAVGAVLAPFRARREFTIHGYRKRFVAGIESTWYVCESGSSPGDRTSAAGVIVPRDNFAFVSVQLMGFQAPAVVAASFEPVLRGITAG